MSFCKVPTYRSGRGVHRGWHGWGQPATLNIDQAAEHSSLLRGEGKCGATTETRSNGTAVCDSYCYHDGRHMDDRLAVVWGES